MAEKVVVFIHEFQDQPFDPEEKGQAIKERLEKDGWTVYCLSYSAGRETVLSFHDATGVLVSEIRARGIKKINAVVGHSRGGIIACDLAKRYREFGIKTVIMLETPILGLPALFLRIWRFFTQRRASYSWPSVPDMRSGGPLVDLNKDWPEDIRRLEIGGSLSVMLKRFYKLPEGMYVKTFPKVGHDGPNGLRGDPEVLEHIAHLLKVYSGVTA